MVESLAPAGCGMTQVQQATCKCQRQPLGGEPRVRRSAALKAAHGPGAQTSLGSPGPGRSTGPCIPVGEA